MALIFTRGSRGDVARLNPWLVPYLDVLEPVCSTPIPVRTPTADRARAEAAWLRMASGRGVWNQWAKGMLALLPDLAEDARLLRLWDYAAAVELRAIGELDMVGFIIPGACRLAGATVGDYFTASYAEFHGAFDARNAVFTREAAFECATFHRGAAFDNAIFEGPAQFRRTKFLWSASFRGTEFRKEAWFRRASFDGAFDAAGAAFCGDAGFGECLFGEKADFSAATFKDNAGFDAVIFEKPARFCDARFARNAWFRGAQMDSGTNFERTRFAARVDFEGAGMFEEQPSPVAVLIEAIEQRWRAAR